MGATKYLHGHGETRDRDNQWQVELIKHGPMKRQKWVQDKTINQWEHDRWDEQTMN